MNLDDTPKEACGIIGVVGDGKPIAEQILFGLMALQHRGQESAGIAVADGQGRINVKRVMGLAGEGFAQEDLSPLQGNVGIGHVRYSTVGTSVISEAQPFCQGIPRNGLALGFNGNIVNYRELREQLIEDHVTLESRSDAEIFLHLLSREIRETADPFKALTNLSKIIEGGYSVVCLSGEGELLAFRDPLGLRPFCFGYKGQSFICASESVAIDMLGGELKGDIRPGEAFFISNRTVERKQFATSERKAHCMFEYVYFSRPDSVIDGRPVYNVRLRLGENLAKLNRKKVDIIIPVPDTSRPAAEGASRLSGVPVAEGLIKNRYVHRTFIMPEQTRRESAVKAKLNPMKSVIARQRILLIDDSIVRGTTLKGIVNMIKKSGAKAVHVSITCPPLISPCFYGIDIATHKELIASKNSVEEIGRQIEADSLQYQSIDGLIDAIGMRKEDLCNACLTGQYPTPKAQVLADQMKEKQFGEGRVRYIEIGT